MLLSSKRTGQQWEYGVRRLLSSAIIFPNVLYSVSTSLLHSAIYEVFTMQHPDNILRTQETEGQMHVHPLPYARNHNTLYHETIDVNFPLRVNSTSKDHKGGTNSLCLNTACIMAGRVPPPPQHESFGSGVHHPQTLGKCLHA